MSLTFPIFWIIVLFANLTEAVAGFGSTLLSLTLGAQLYPMEGLVPVLVPLNLLLSGVLVFKHHRTIDRKQLLTRILPLAGTGLPLGLLAFQFAPGRSLKIAFGLIVFTLAAVQLFQFWQIARRPEGAEVQVPRAWTKLESALFLIAGGFMQGLYASGCLFIVYYTSRAIRNKSAFRSTLCTLWLILNLVVCSTLALTGKITLESLKTTALLLPAVVLGIMAVQKVHRRISENSFTLGVYVLLALAGLSLIFRN